MATSFRNHKKNIWADYVDNDKKTPEFKRTLEKQRPHWDDFMTFKESEIFKERSRKNKLIAEKK
jgi:hypothetical protein